jgi:peptide/nickel transport system substrate-binding protein
LEAEPKVGGTLVVALPGEPDTLDAHQSSSLSTAVVTVLIGASLAAPAPDGQIVPYLAERWEASEEGLVWTFYLKKGVTFHDGTPFTARDYVWTIRRAQEPAHRAKEAGVRFQAVAAAEALDDYTLQIRLEQPDVTILFNLMHSQYVMPLSQSAVEAWGDAYGRHPMSVGPYRFKEWMAGHKIVLERNPDFDWGPGYAHQGPRFIQEIEFRILPDYATIAAGLEAQEIDLAFFVQPNDVARLRETGGFQISEQVHQGAHPFVALNRAQPPFDDLRVRQAFNLAVDKGPLIEAVALGHAIPQYGPISPAVAGYWPGVEEIGYRYDLDRARALMAQAGYAPNDEGLLERDGKPLRLTLKAPSVHPDLVKTAEVLQAQYRALGADIEIAVQEPASLTEDRQRGDFELMVTRFNALEADVLFRQYHSSTGFSGDTAEAPDLELDRILEQTRATVDPQARQGWLNEAQRRIVEQAYLVPLYTPITYWALSTRVVGAVFPRLTNGLFLDDAYIESER